MRGVNPSRSPAEGSPDTPGAPNPALEMPSGANSRSCINDSHVLKVTLSAMAPATT